ncbi:MAG: swr complex subunit [Cirrosporium novae-zelandiae]|nr:MAG: swr complex subunit [Cirrosporium novae-zelandiae]
MSSADVRDMLDLPAGDLQPRPAKKQKIVEKRPEGISRELFQLLGDRAPPVALTSQRKYKNRPKWAQKVTPWEKAPFTNSARSDGLVLYHWQKKKDKTTASAPAATSSAIKEERMDIDGQDKKDVAPATESTSLVYPWAKLNVKVEGPKYNDDQYKSHLANENWTKEETDYLVEMAIEYGLRWPIIWDRYDYQSSSPSTSSDQTQAVIPTPKVRSLEDLKSRYYTVAAKSMALHTPPSNMTPSEFDLYEKMLKFDPKQETNRKHLAASLLHRSTEEVAEEELLLGELQRIITNEEKLAQERKEIYDRFESPQSTGNTTSMYQSSQALAGLMHQLITADKQKKRRSLLASGAITANAAAAGDNTPASSPSAPPSATNTHHGHRDSLASNKNKSTPTSHQPPQPRILSPTEEIRYGVQHHERLTSGIAFRYERLSKHTSAKSNVQNQKIAAAMTELNIPPRLVMPTENVCNAYERLIAEVMLLLDVRKIREKVENEIKVREAQKETTEKEKEGEDENAEANVSRDVEMGDSTQATEQSEASASNVNGETEEDAVKQTPKKSRPTPEKATPEFKKEIQQSRSQSRPPSQGHTSPKSFSGHKRSQSVLSTTSNRSTTKKQKK